MKKFILASLFLSLIFPIDFNAQSALSIEKIMKGENFTGYSPTDIRWSPDSKKIFFSWNPEMDIIRSQYIFATDTRETSKATTEQLKNQPPVNIVYNPSRSLSAWTADGDIFLMDNRTGKTNKIISTLAVESSLDFTLDGSRVVFTSQNNLFSWEIATGQLTQVTDFRQGKEKTDNTTNERDNWLNKDEMSLFNTLRSRKEIRDAEKKIADESKSARPKTIYTGSSVLSSLKMSPDQNYITYILFNPAEDRKTIVPNYVTESGYTEEIQSRSKVGVSTYPSGTMNILDIMNDTVYPVIISDIPGLDDKPDFIKDYPSRKEDKKQKRGLAISNPVWSDNGKMAVLDIVSDDHKDRWIMLLDISSGKLKLVDRQRDEAWIGGPGIGRGNVGWLPDNKIIWFQSEASGYSHIYTYDITTGSGKAVTSGNFEIYDLKLSADKKTFYFISNEIDPGIMELFSMPVTGGARKRITEFNGGVEYELSPDEKLFALRISEADKPWELAVMENKPGAKPAIITHSTTPEFRSYNWRIPEVIRIKATDGAMIPARIYRPTEQKKNGPAVIFVHGAGYLQNAHHWWSNYSREYMFHNFLADNGYTVLDIDYRGSAGYGRDWRTAIYRYMGGKDLDDHVDAAKYLVEQQQVDPGKIGIYGGSYGGFITLMALLTKPGVFRAGAALRPVTDWAHYNHGYTSNILNTPALDSIAYAKSSPIYYADGLQDALLICHGMIDDNVHFQDVVRLSQKLIELGKENWQLAVYPLESHGFIEASSWTDEYRRIFRLWEDKLK